ncbi:uncharacterized protein EI90DRAFT_3146988 [Cantharellus anzutake]|uniref:uncharacterized protein n=1 Tax=Cantharellus anzutake TaxID=1750568 RepID=UPI00190709CA|nr:uncharacterized protein EI90DRAFT_3146988 [Cantharellus anzutake]KAF8323537.1 hypothetical protein EI90DRAFT_3146988 [Cantharellus anzutake]
MPASDSVLDGPEEGLPPDFAAELAAGMEALMKDLGRTPNDDGRLRHEAWEKLLIAELESYENGNSLELTEAVSGTPPPGGSSPEPVSRSPDAGAMDKLKSSEDNLKVDSLFTEDLSAPFDPAKLLQEFKFDDLLGESGDSGQDVQDILEGMMRQLMSKDILYEPLKDLDEKYPIYLRENKAKISAEENNRYLLQHTKVHELVAVFEQPGYKDGDSAYSAELMKLMNEMQSYGSPPTELMGNLPPGFNLGEDGMPQLDEGCVVV